MYSGTQVSKWTKMGEELQKVAAHKLVESRRSKMTGSARIYDHLYDEDISGKNEFVSESGVALCSVGVQVSFVAVWILEFSCMQQCIFKIHFFSSSKNISFQCILHSLFLNIINIC